MKIVMVHEELVHEAKEETAGSLGGRRWRFDEEERKT